MSNEIQKSYSMEDMTNASNSIVKRALRDLDRKLRNSSKTDCGTDSDRFIRLADDYKEAVLFLDVAGSTVRIETDNAGQLKFSFEKFDEVEPAAVISELSGKIMILKYERGEFNEKWVKKPFADTADFTGELAETILMLRIIFAD